MNKTVRKHERIKAGAEALFQRPVRDISFPGGESRASLRLHFDDMTVIGSLRPNFRRTHLEAFILQKLAPVCDDVPVCHGVMGDIMFQSDVGSRRLNTEIRKHAAADRVALAEDAVAAIFRIQAAARHTDLGTTLPRLGNNAEWLAQLVNDVDILGPLLDRGIPDSFNRVELPAYLDQCGIQFVKWDCRSGNAALGDDGRLRWFDFEYAGMRHGAEDFAWLIGDESWPVDAETMLEIVEDGFDPSCGHDFDHYMEYLSIYTVLHCIQRLKLILGEVESRGWRSIEEIVERDDVGRHPLLAAHLCRTAAWFADRQSTTDMLVPFLEAAERRFMDATE